MKQGLRQSLCLGVIAIALSACQSAPENEEATDEMQQPVTAEDTESTESYGAGDRSDIEGMDSSNAVDMTGGMDDDAMAGSGRGQGVNGYGGGDDTAQMLETMTFYFGFDESSLQTDALEALRAHAQYLNENSNAKVRLKGHADERGTREYNLALGERRGNAVAKFLKLNGVGASQIEVTSLGEEEPVAFGHDEQAWSANRRVELTYTAGAP